MNDGTDETSEEATYRCLKREYGITKKIPLKVLGGVKYFAADGKLCENEYDVILVGEFSGKLRPNKLVAYNYKWVEKKEFLKDISENPEKYSPWVIKAIPILKRFVTSKS